MRARLSGNIAMLNLWECSGLVRSATLAIALVAPLTIAADGNAEIIKVEDMARGISITREQCATILQAVWVNALGRDFCARYYMSTAGGEGRRPVVFLQGDKLGRLDGKAGTWVDTSESKDVDTDDLQRFADNFSRMTRTTAIYLARIGVDGTSGSHTARKTVLERELMNAALDAIKQRYHFEGFHLAGQSGGSTILVGLLALRTDVACAVTGAGGILTGIKPSATEQDPGRLYFDPSAGIPEILRKHREARLFFVTDPEDKRAPAPGQDKFVQRLRQAGGQAEQLIVIATDEYRHGVLEYTRLVMGGCVLGKSNVDIARAVSTIVKRNTEFTERKKQESKAKAAAPAERPASEPRPARGDS
jgi:hypothetical protein